MTDAELAILSLTAEAPRHGYEIEQIIEARGMREWIEIGFSSIYYVLKKLGEAGLVESQTMPTQGRGSARRVYQITATGWAALNAATLEALAQPKRSYSPILLGLANLPIISGQQALQALQSYHEGVTTRLEQVTARAEAQRPLPDHVELLFDYSLTLLAAEKAWVEKVIQTMEAKNDKS